MLRNLAVLGLLCVPFRAPAQDLAELLPDRTVACVDLVGGGALVAGIEGLLRTLPELPARARLGIAALDFGVRSASDGLPLDRLAAEIVPGAACAGVIVDPRGPALVAIVAAPGSALDRVLERAAGRVACGRSGDLALLAPDAERLAELRAAVEGRAPRLGGRAGFVTGRNAAPSGGRLRIHVDLARIRALLPEPRSLWDRTPVDGRLFFGPFAAAADVASRFDGEIAVAEDMLVFRGRLDGSAAVDGPARVLLARAGDSRYLPANPPPGVFVTLALDRSVRRALVAVDDVFGEAGAARVRAGLGTLDTLVGGSFVDDLLPALGEGWTLYLVHTPPPEDCGVGLALPAIALVAPVVERDAAEERLFRLAGTLALAANAERARRDQPPFRLRRSDTEHGSVLFAEPDPWRGPPPPPLEMGWSPTFAVTDELVIVATHRDVAEAFATHRAADRVFGDRLQLDPGGVAEWIAWNRDRVALGQVLDDGKTLIAARQDVDDIAAVLRCFRSLTVDVIPERDATRVQLVLEVRR